MSLASKKIPQSELNASTIADSTNEENFLWSEWTDAKLNSENWSTPKNGKDGLFLDTQVVPMPPSLEPYEWIRAKDLNNLTAPLAVFVPNVKRPDLIINNGHLLHSESARWFISTLINLQYCGRNGLEISGENGNFIWNGNSQPWQGWMNVYSMNKAGKGAQHRPTINPIGKYIARLHFLGFWRSIVIDDMIPVNVEGNPLLPRTENNFELWPMLLSKALLKLCSLSWSRQREIVDFHPVSCLTGWVCLRLNIGYLSPQDKWDMLTKYAEHFEWTPEAGELENKGWSSAARICHSNNFVYSFNAPRAGLPKSKATPEGKKHKGNIQTKKSKETVKTKSTKEDFPMVQLPSKPEPVTLFLGLEDTSDLEPEIVPGLSSCWSHFVYVAQSRDIPLDPKDVKPPLPRWKLFRWLKWAIERGIVDPVEYFTPIRCVKIVVQSAINDSDNAEKSTSHQTRPKEESRKPDGNKPPTNYSREPPKNPEKEASSDVSQWADFNKIQSYIKEMYFFYKLEYFEYTARISDGPLTMQLPDKRSETKKGSKKSSPSRATSTKDTLKDTEFIDFYNWPLKMTKTRNEPLYLLCDSTDKKFFLIHFSTLRPFPSSEEIMDSMINQNEQNYLVVEKHSWFRSLVKSDFLVSVSTNGTKSTVMELSPGRHLLRLNRRSNHGCFITISSDTVFHLGNRSTMYRLMSQESDTIDGIVKGISNSVCKTYQAFGTDAYPQTLKEYYKSYMPIIQNTQKSDKTLCKQIHGYFIDEQVKLIGTIFSEEDAKSVVRALRIFFMNPSIGLNRFNSVMLENRQELSTKFNLRKPSTKLNSIKYVDKNNGNIYYEYAAAVIQSFFKMILIKRYKAMHHPSHPQHDRVLTDLLKLVSLFDYTKRESVAHQLLRNVINHHDRLRDLYPFSQDFQNVLHIQERKGSLINVKSNCWVPIVRLKVNPRSSEVVFAAITLFINLPKYSLRVFKNDNGLEIFNIVNNVAPAQYLQCINGYTIFAYGWTEEVKLKELEWTLNIITMKGEPIFCPLDKTEPLDSKTELPTLLTEELSGTYVPNTRSCISKWRIKIDKRSFVSFRLKTSYDMVEVRLRIVDEEDDVLQQVDGKSVVILPVACLQIEKPSLGDVRESKIRFTDVEDDAGRGLKESISYEYESVQDFEDGTNSKGNGAESERKGDTVKERIYYVEAIVLNDSWPLTESEWSTVADAKAKMAGSFVKTKISSVSSGGKLSKTELARTKRSSKHSVDSNLSLEPPYWILQVVTDAGSGLEISQDRSREMELARLKETWAKENPESLQRGRELREAFIKKHAISPSVSLKSKLSIVSERSARRDSRKSSINDLPTASTTKAEVRTLKPPQTYPKLPPLDLSVYMIDEEEEMSLFPKTDLNVDALKEQYEAKVTSFRENYSNFQNKMKKLLKKQRVKYQRLFKEHNESYWERRLQLIDVHEAKKIYWNSVKPVNIASSVKSSKKGKKS